MRTLACQNLDTTERLWSSSGAIFPLLAKAILKDKGVVFGAAFDDNFQVVHIGVTEEKDLGRLTGSKYVYSQTKTAFQQCREYLEEGRKVLFTGTPCQIAGVKAFLRKDYPNLYLADCVCHGAPDSKIWTQYLTELSAGRMPSYVNFRDKKDGWVNYHLTVRFSNGDEYSMHHQDDPYMQAFRGNLTLRQACFHCRFKGTEGRESDLTMGDLWGASEIVPELFDDKGTSLIMLHTDKGEALFSEIRKEVAAKEIDAGPAIEKNPAVITASRPNLNLQRFNQYYKKTGNLTESIRRYVKPGKMTKILHKLSLALGER